MEKVNYYYQMVLNILVILKKIKLKVKENLNGMNIKFIMEIGRIIL